MPMNRRNSLMLVGGCISLIADTFAGPRVTLLRDECNLFQSDVQFVLVEFDALLQTPLEKLSQVVIVLFGCLAVDHYAVRYADDA